MVPTGFYIQKYLELVQVYRRAPVVTYLAPLFQTRRLDAGNFANGVYVRVSLAWWGGGGGLGWGLEIRIVDFFTMNTHPWPLVIFVYWYRISQYQYAGQSDCSAAPHYSR